MVDDLKSVFGSELLRVPGGWKLSERDDRRADSFIAYHMRDRSFGFLRVVNLVHDGVQDFVVHVVRQLIEVVVTEMRLVRPRCFAAGELRSESFERHINLKNSEGIKISFKA